LRKRRPAGKARSRQNIDAVAASILLREYLERTPAPKKGGD
jgi:RNase H-fold protein (predicted Holliday junction resolvase)